MASPGWSIVQVPCFCMAYKKTIETNLPAASPVLVDAAVLLFFDWKSVTLFLSWKLPMTAA